MKKLIHKIQILVLAAALGLGLNSCSDWLELYPEGETLLEDFWKSASDVEGVVASCYRAMLEQDAMTRILVWGEVRSDNLQYGQKVDGMADGGELMKANLLETNAYCNWASLYVPINYCNTVCHFAPQVLDVDKNFSVNQMHAYCAEAMAVRALCYFYLVRAFGAVPYRTSATIDDDENFNVPATDGKIILDSMIVYLKQAKEWAQVSYSATSSYGDYNKGRFTKQSIRALLADIYLWQGYYEECLAECNEFLAYNNTLKLTDANYLSLEQSEYLLSEVFYRGNSSESIFELQFPSGGVGNGAVKALYGGILEEANGQVAAAMGALEPIFTNTKDMRLTQFVKNPVSGVYNIAKYTTVSCTETLGQKYHSTRSTSSIDWIIYRLADIYLMRAEALVELSSGEGDEKLTEAMTMVNKTYYRATTTVTKTGDTLNINNYKTKEQMRELVLDERQREFMFEGKRWFDLLRAARKDNDPQVVIDHVLLKDYYQGTSENLVKSKFASMDALYWPYYESELDANDQLVQNPFYKMDETTERN